MVQRLMHRSQSTKLLNTGLVTSWMGDCLLISKPSHYVPNHLDQLSLPSLWDRVIEYQPVWQGLRVGVFTIVGWQVQLQGITCHHTVV